MDTPPLSRQRRVFLWLSWTVATTAGSAIGWYISIACFPWEDYFESRTALYPTLLLVGFSPGIFVDMAQYVVLRLHLPGVKWFPWLIVTAFGQTLGYAMSMMVSLSVIDWNTIKSLLSSYGAFIAVYAPVGLIPGIAQAPVLMATLSTRRGWLWLPICAVASTCSGLMWSSFLVPVESRPFFLVLEGAVYGALTGLGLALLLRGAPLKQEKNEAESS